MSKYTSRIFFIHYILDTCRMELQQKTVSRCSPVKNPILVPRTTSFIVLWYEVNCAWCPWIWGYGEYPGISSVPPPPPHLHTILREGGTLGTFLTFKLVLLLVCGPWREVGTVPSIGPVATPSNFTTGKILRVTSTGEILQVKEEVPLEIQYKQGVFGLYQKEINLAIKDIQYMTTILTSFQVGWGR